jgi:hypothetical protein
MPRFAEVLEEIQQEHEAVRRAWSRGDDPERLTEGEPGERPVRPRRRGAPDPRHAESLLEAIRFMNEVYEGRRPLEHLREAMTTDDFPSLFGDILDREVLAGFRETPRTFEAYFRVNNQVRDFRERVIFALDGGEGVLDKVGEREEYPEAAVDDSEKARYKVEKYGRVFDLSWETLQNDDLGAFRALPTRLGRAARRSEEKFATQQFVDASGPHASVFTVGNENLVTGEPPLSIEGLRVALADLAAQTDTDGEPIFIETVHLVVPPALEVTANNILNALQLEITGEVGGTSGQKLIVANWIRNRMQVHVNRYIPIIASTANGDTSWFLIGDPGVDRPFAEFGRLRGHAEPELWVRESNARRIGGGPVPPEEGSFETDSVRYRVRHVFGATVVEPIMAIASNGTA